MASLRGEGRRGPGRWAPAPAAGPFSSAAPGGSGAAGSSGWASGRGCGVWRKNGLRPGRAAEGVQRGGACGAGGPGPRRAARRPLHSLGGGAGGRLGEGKGLARVTAVDWRVKSKLVRRSHQISLERNGEGWVVVEIAKIGIVSLLPFILALMCEVREFSFWG